MCGVWSAAADQTPPIHSDKYQCRIDTVIFSWWWAHGSPKHVEKRNKYIKQNYAPSWTYLRDYTGLHGQQNIIFRSVLFSHRKCKTEWYKTCFLFSIQYKLEYITGIDICVYCGLILVWARRLNVQIHCSTVDRILCFRSCVAVEKRERIGLC